MSNIIYANFTGNNTRIMTDPVYQWDTGRKMIITGIDLPFAYKVDFSNDMNKGDSETYVGGEDGVLVPDDLLATGKYVYAFFVLVDDDYKVTECRITIPVIPRPKDTDITPTPTQQSTIDNLIDHMDDAVEASNDYALVAEGYAKGTQNGTAVTSESPYYENNAYYFEELAKQYASDALSYKNDAYQYKLDAESAQSAAEIAQGKAEDAQGYAETAQGKAEDARDKALEYSEDAEQSAERAEQAAQTAGYLDVEIDEHGHLIYIKTDAVDVDFDLNDQGHLIMEAV